MRACVTIVAGALMICSAVGAVAAEKMDAAAQLAAARRSVEETAARVGNYPQALSEMEKARAALKKAEQAYEKGRQWMGLGGLKPEAEQEVRHHLQVVELTSVLAGYRAAKGRNDEDTAVLDKQIGLLKGRVKLLEERMQAEASLRRELQKTEAAGKELAAIKEEQGRSKALLEQLAAEKKKLEEQVAALTAEKAALSAQLDALKKAAPPAAPPPPAPAAVPAPPAPPAAQ